jgi:RHS repeat-associated protein
VQSNPLVTTYDYDPGTGELLATRYSDGTADINYTYTRTGLGQTVTDAAGQCSFSYTDTMQLDSETLPVAFYGDKVLTRKYESVPQQGAIPGRAAGVMVGIAAEPAADLDVNYAFDTKGRFAALSAGAHTVTAQFLANSDLTSKLIRSNEVDTLIGYEPGRDLIAAVVHEKPGAADPLAEYGYVNDAVGRRAARDHAGTAFAVADTIAYSYNARSEVTGAMSANDPGYAYSYEFDPIGNRTSSHEVAETRSYAANQLNQYTAVTGLPAPTYDADGNQTSLALDSGDWQCEYNCENRLVALEKTGQRLEFTYDYMGRRIAKKVFSGGSGSWSLERHDRFVYDGFRVVQRLDALNPSAPAVLQQFVWSPGDRLRMIVGVPDATTYFVHHDANRNVTELTAPDGAVAAHYEYAPFGGGVRQTGTYAEANPFRFSSEYFDAETGLVYYNYRYYSPELGRWLTRDPIQEQGGLNLMGMLANNVLNYVDLLGLKKCCIDGELIDVDCRKLTRHRRNLLDMAAEGIKDMGKLNSHFATAQVMNDLSLLQTTIMGAMTAGSTAKSLADNAQKHAAKILTSASGRNYVSTQAFTSSGKMVFPSKATSMAEKARRAGAVGVGAYFSGNIIVKEMRNRGLKKAVHGTSWVLDPAGEASKRITEEAASASEIIYQAVQNLHNMVRTLNAKYSKCCGW